MCTQKDLVKMADEGGWVGRCLSQYVPATKAQGPEF